MRRLALFLLILPSCQGDSFFVRWFQGWKDYSLTQLASQVSAYNLTERDREDLLELFDALREARVSECRYMQDIIEGHRVLRIFEDNLDLNRGFLFDELPGYDYASSLTDLERSPAESAVFTVVSVWKTQASLKRIEAVSAKISRCYPDEYLKEFA